MARAVGLRHGLRGTAIDCKFLNRLRRLRLPARLAPQFAQPLEDFAAGFDEHGANSFENLRDVIHLDQQSVKIYVSPLSPFSPGH